jgi:nucleoid-associated protein YgaU
MKYLPLLDLGKQLGAKDVHVEEKEGKLWVRATVASPTEKNRIWDKIKEIGGSSNPADIVADIRTESETPSGAGHAGAAGAASRSGKTYTVKSGDTLSKIAKDHYGNANEYMKIFEANRNLIQDPDHIRPGMELTIP